MMINIEYFAVLREHTGLSGERWDTSADSLRALYREIDTKYAFPKLSNLKVAVNDEFADWDDRLQEGDRVVFIPPVAGG